MILDELLPEAITEGILKRLIDSQISEGPTVEYKIAFYGNADIDKRELLKDVSALANSQGGHIVFGMAEDQGLPTDLPGLDINPDDAIRRLENLCRDCIQPRIMGVRPIPLRLENGKTALVVRVPRSWNRPHRTSYQGTNRYFIRTTGGIHEASVEELRELFTDSLTRAARAERFVSERIAKIEANQGAIPIRHGGRAVVHIMPFGALAGETTIDLDAALANGNFAPLGSTGYNHDYNLYGLVTYRAVAENGYLQLFRNGFVETVNTDIGTAIPTTSCPSWAYGRC